jgi:DNA-directed RNA polymerase I and III subunit RPAC2
MPGTTEEKAPVPIVDPTTATEEEIDPAIDRDRIRVVRKLYQARDE